MNKYSGDYSKNSYNDDNQVLSEINYVSRSNARMDFRRDRDPVDQKRIYNQKFYDHADEIRSILEKGSPSKAESSFEQKHEDRRNNYATERYSESIRPTSSTIWTKYESRSSNYDVSRNNQDVKNTSYELRIPSYNYSINYEPNYDVKPNTIEEHNPKERLLTPTKYRKGPKKAPVEETKIESKPKPPPSPKETSPVPPLNQLPQLSLSDITFQPPPSTSSTPKTVLPNTPTPRTQISISKPSISPPKLISKPKPSSDAFSLYQSKFSQGTFS